MNKTIAPLDLSWLLFETPAGTTHVGAMLLFKKPRGHAAAVREIVDAYRAFRPTPPFNFVPELVGHGAPHFREADDWDPHYHVGHLSLPAGSSYQDLLRLVADLHEPMLDRDRLLFRCWIIDGVPGGRFAIYTKTHHSVVDGVSGLRMLYRGLSDVAEPTVPEPAFALPSAPRTPPEPTPLLHKITDSIRSVVSQAGTVNQISMGMLRKALTAAIGADPKGSLPFLAHHAPTNQPLKQGRSFATLSLPLDEMHEIGHRFGGTLNDVAATIVDAGLHAYLADTGDPFAHRLIAMVPVSLRDDGDSTVGTRVSALFVRLGEPKPTAARRIRQVVESVKLAKEELAGWSSDAAMTYGAGLLGLAVLGASTHVDQVTPPACNLVISNVPGVGEPRYLNGARLLGIYPISALAASIGLNVTLSSYHDHMDFGFVANASSINDVAALAEHTLQAYRDRQARCRKADPGSRRRIARICSRRAILRLLAVEQELQHQVGECLGLLDLRAVPGVVDDGGARAGDLPGDLGRPPRGQQLVPRSLDHQHRHGDPLVGTPARRRGRLLPGRDDETALPPTTPRPQARCWTRSAGAHRPRRPGRPDRRTAPPRSHASPRRWRRTRRGRWCGGSSESHHRRRSPPHCVPAAPAAPR